MFISIFISFLVNFNNFVYYFRNFDLVLMVYITRYVWICNFIRIYICLLKNFYILLFIPFNYYYCCFGQSFYFYYLCYYYWKNYLYAFSYFSFFYWYYCYIIFSSFAGKVHQNLGILWVHYHNLFYILYSFGNFVKSLLYYHYYYCFNYYYYLDDYYYFEHFRVIICIID